MPVSSLFKNAIKASVGNVFVTIYTAPVGMDSYAIELDVANNGNTGVQITTRIFDASESVVANIVKLAPVPVGSALQVIDGQKIVLEAGDYIELKCDTPGETVDVILSLIEDVNS
jgi:hypothetical protein